MYEMLKAMVENNNAAWGRLNIDAFSIIRSLTPVKYGIGIFLTGTQGEAPFEATIEAETEQEALDIAESTLACFSA